MQPILQVTNENLYGNMYSLVGKTTLPELAAIIRNATLTISPNSLNMQFADVFGCPMVILHSETGIVQQWLPRHAIRTTIGAKASKGIFGYEIAPEKNESSPGR